MLRTSFNFSAVGTPPNRVSFSLMNRAGATAGPYFWYRGWISAMK